MTFLGKLVSTLPKVSKEKVEELMYTPISKLGRPKKTKPEVLIFRNLIVSEEEALNK